MRIDSVVTEAEEWNQLQNTKKIVILLHFSRIKEYICWQSHIDINKPLTCQFVGPFQWDKLKQIFNFIYFYFLKIQIMLYFAEVQVKSWCVRGKSKTSELMAADNCIVFGLMTLFLGISLVLINEKCTLSFR